VSGSAAQTRSFNTSQQIVYRATFTDGISAIVRMDMPRLALHLLQKSFGAGFRKGGVVDFAVHLDERDAGAQV
jgi:hypothetical protein